MHTKGLPVLASAPAKKTDFIACKSIPEQGEPKVLWDVPSIQVYQVGCQPLMVRTPLNLPVDAVQ